MRAARELVEELRGEGLAERAACRAVGLGRSSYRYRGQDDATRQRLSATVLRLAGQHRRYGYRRIGALLRRDGVLVNHKRLWAIWREQAGLERAAATAQAATGHAGGGPAEYRRVAQSRLDLRLSL